MQRPRGGPVWIERAIDHSPYSSIYFRGNPYALTYGSTFQKAALKAALPESLFKKQRWKLRFQSHFSKSRAGSCDSRVTFQKVELEAALPESLFKKQRWKLHFRSHFSKSRAGSCDSSSTFFLSNAKPSGFSLISFIGEIRLSGHSLHRVRSGVSPTSIR